MNQFSFKQYRRLDLTIWAVITIVFEGLTTVATVNWFYAQPIALSVTLTIVCIVMLRWGAYAMIHAVVGGMVFCFLSGASAEQYLIYCVGNAFAILALYMISRDKDDMLRENVWKLGVFAVIAYVGMSVGRWLVSLLFGGDIVALAVYLTTDIISLLFAMILLQILRKSDGMIENQRDYLIRINEEETEEFYENQG